MRYLIIVAGLLSGRAAFAMSDAALETAARGGIAGIAMGILACIGILCWLAISWVKREAVPKAKELVKTGAGIALKSAKEFQDRNKVCPFCAETIKREATVCRHCQRSL